MEKKEIGKDFFIEVILQVFIKINKKLEELKKEDNIYEMEVLEKDVVEKYEKLLIGLKSEEFNLEEMGAEKVNNIKKYIDDIMKKNEFTDEFILSQLTKRKELVGDSGAEVVKNLFEYEKKSLSKTKFELLDRANILLDREEKLEMELKDAIQEEAQIELIYKLQPIREEYRTLEEKILKLQKKIDENSKKLESFWAYEIYGTTPKSEMLGIFNQTMKK